MNSWWTSSHADFSGLSADKKPIRSELFSGERLEQHARSLAAALPIHDRTIAGHPLLARLSDNERVLLAAYRNVADAVLARRSITPAAEWLLDNYHIVEQQIRQARADLPAGYYRQLPKLADGFLEGYPRVLGVVWAYIAHTDSHFEAASLTRFLVAFQSVVPLSIGELWAIAITLRILLIENLRRLAEELVWLRAEKDAADALIDRTLGVAERPPEPSAIRTVDASPLSDAFLVQLVHRLRDRDPAEVPALHWLEERLRRDRLNGDELVQHDLQRQGAANVTVRNVITSLRLVSDVDWPALVEAVSPVDGVLARTSGYASLDFTTRNLYRTAIEQIARLSRMSEVSVAERAVGHALKTTANADARHADPGYWLIGPARRAFEVEIGVRHKPSLGRTLHNMRLPGYLTFVSVVATAFLVLSLIGLRDVGVPAGVLAVMVVFGALVVVEAGVVIVNALITATGATRLPSLDLQEGVPGCLRTLVAIPTLLAGPQAVEELVDRLEVHYLANARGALHFALVTDWVDSDIETRIEDGPLLARVRAGIDRLNRRYPPSGGEFPRFLLLHRRRQWNAAQGKWMGWERKRGKLHELNRLLRGATDTSFLPGPTLPTDIRYVVTLDSDTRLPRDSVQRLVGRMAHPLNRPLLDPESQRVVDGYAILQPRVTPSLAKGAEGSLFQQIFSANSGIDPYASAISDVYQDLFGEGTYTGKGIYDVDAFEAALAGRVPDNTLLSHDLFEGTFARAGLVTDIEVIEDYPVRYDVAAARQHRWARGDWQLLPWLLRRDRTAADGLPWLGRWKMLDNLRRSLMAPAMMAALVAGWFLPAEAAAAWTLFVLLVIAIPALLPLGPAIVPRHAGVAVGAHLRAVGIEVRNAIVQTSLLVFFLPYQTWLMGDAILRTLWRLFVSRRHLLDWTTAHQAEASLGFGWLAYHRRMAGGLFLTLLIVPFAWKAAHGAATIALPFVVAWLLAPTVAFLISRPVARTSNPAVGHDDTARLRRIARQTWRFFETFVNANDHYLPPDNFQEDPAPVVAHRTSPTNMGLYLLSVVSAHDFGWIGRAEALSRIEATLATIEGLARHRGHFFNWYDTQSLAVLQPPYVSSVDSGNLAGHLLAVARVLAAWRDDFTASSHWSSNNAHARAGAADALQLARTAMAAADDAVPALEEARRAIRAALDAAPGNFPAAVDAVARVTSTALPPEARYWMEAAARTLRSHREDREFGKDGEEGGYDALARRAGNLEHAARALALAMDFEFLLDPERLYLAIGYSAADDRLDPGHYDLLASEARLASLVAIAKGDVPTRHWFRLGRELTPVGTGAALVSWSGSMFEYLMTSLVMRAPTGSLLQQSNDRVVQRQRQFAEPLDIPWGISEAAYNARDTSLNYQYSNFGVPGLGFKRGLSENLVIAPYATALATMVDPRASIENFARLEALGALGTYGFYESIDFTPTRLPEGARYAVVRAWMAHHQGMSIVALANAVFDGRMRARFHEDPLIRAAELLLEERAPRDITVSHPRAEEVQVAARIENLDAPVVRRIHNPHAPGPSVHLLSNGRFSTMLTAAGSGYARWGKLAVTRWREDATRDDWGIYLYLADVEGRVWSSGWQPVGSRPDDYHVTFAEDRAEFRRRDGTIATRLEVVVSSEDDAEVRRLTLSNEGPAPAEITVTSYAELVLAPDAADIAHQVFSKLFVQTEFYAPLAALLATRRRRGPDEPEIWVGHLLVTDEPLIGDLEFETDRARFLGRCNGVEDAAAIFANRSLSGTTGQVLDPIFSLRRRVIVQPGRSCTLAFWTMVAASREELLNVMYRQADKGSFERASTLAWTQAQVQLRHLGISSAEASLFQRIASFILYANPVLRSPRDVIRQGMAPANRLWPQGISGDLPIVLLRIATEEELGLVRELLRAFEYWRLKGLAVDLVILNERAASYVQDLQGAIEALVRSSHSAAQLGFATPGKVFPLRADIVSPETRAALLAVARVVLLGRRGGLGDQLARVQTPRGLLPPRRRQPATDDDERRPTLAALGALRFFNGTGGFSPNGREYVTVLGPGRNTPAPWINVVSGPEFGFQVAADGAGYTWSRNSRDNQLTPWSNDPVTDRPGEIFYLRDRDEGTLWTPTAAPIRLPGVTYMARHGWGYTRFDVVARGLSVELLQFVPLDHSLKVSRLVIRNISGRARKLSVTGYVEWVLGLSRGIAASTVVTDRDPATGAIFARNPWNIDHGTRVAYFDVAGREATWTADRSEFIGRNCTTANPAALNGAVPLSGRIGGGLDPCAVLQTEIELAAGEAKEIVFFLGQAAHDAAAQAALAEARALNLDAAHQAVSAFWSRTAGALQVQTPDQSLDLLVNGWLSYQTLACRVWARSAFYQASGAYGFRDQLQDVMSFTATRPELTRAQILRAAARQFVEGDVQHWWFEPSGRGVRTRISDDLLWLAYVTAHYVETTADTSILDQPVSFLDGPALTPADHDRYFEPDQAEEAASLFEHCARAIDRSLSVGRHGLPLMGTGDWNDGMNRVGEKGEGESVWLGWFLCAVIDAFIPLAEARDPKRTAIWRAHRAALAHALDDAGWDGDWYRRGFYDDGTALGSASSDECRIDAIAQSWAAISGAGEAARARRAMSAFEEHLLRRDSRLSLLFTPPFDRTLQDPGYIKGYPAGIRENGGQYTHAACWAIMAFAALGEGTKAADLFALINPINHTASGDGVWRYKVEPYVVAADVYSVAPHEGRGGWTWYTGSAGWLYRAAAESILGIRRRGDHLVVSPCLPSTWPGYEATLTLDETVYAVRVATAEGPANRVIRLTVNGEAGTIIDGAAHIPLRPSGGHLDIEIGLGIPAK